jgi:hypothetical protein
VRDLNTGSQTNYYLENALAASYIIWSDDGMKTFFAAIQGDSWATTYDYSLLAMDHNVNQLYSLYKITNSSDIVIFPIGWNNNSLTIMTVDYSKNQVNTQYFDLYTNQFITPVPTP